MERKSALSLLLLIVAAVMATNAKADEPSLTPWSQNPWYWSFDGKPVLLLGGSDDDNLFQWPEKELITQLDRLAGAGGNVIRNTMSDRNDKDFEVYPFKRNENGKYDLAEWNPEYWKRFERMLKATAERKIVVQIEIWDRFDYTDSGRGNRWQIHPYNPANNINYSYDESGFARRYPDHPGKNKQAFFFTTPGQRNNATVLQYQQRFVEKMLEHSLQFDHVLYCIDNETNGEEEWARYWVQFIRKYAASKGKTINATEMWDDWNLAGEHHKRTFEHPELYDFVDVSQNNHNKGQKHWDNFLHVRKYLAAQPRPMNTTKTYGASGNKFGHSDQDGIERFWRHLLAGAASIRFHRPESGLGLNDKAVASLRAARKVESLVPLWTVEPASELLGNRDANEAYVAANDGQKFVVYFPKGGEVTLNVGGEKDALSVHWINIGTGDFGPQQTLSKTGDRLTLAPPDNKNWVGVIMSTQKSD